MDFKNEKCPVCGQLFSGEDDIVVCPECGTPHHRACWEKENHCANESLHSGGFEWKKNASEEKPAEPQPEVKPENAEQGDEDAPFTMPVFGAGEANDDGFETMLMHGVNADKNDKIDGMRVGDIAFYIQQSARNYINKFLKGKKISINWAALFFGAAWFFYRKLYKAGALVLAVSVAISLFTYPLATNLLNEQAEIQAMMETDENSDEAPTMEEYLALSENPEYVEKTKSYIKRGSIIIGIEVVYHVVLALCANELYRRKMKKDMAAIEQATNETVTKRMLLMQRGGVSFLWGAVVFLAADYIVPMLLSAGKFFMNLF